LIQILNQAKPEEWQAVILDANFELCKFDFQGSVDYFEKLEVRQTLEGIRVGRSQNPNERKVYYIQSTKYYSSLLPDNGTDGS
jgi:hypothetical protein